MGGKKPTHTTVIKESGPRGHTVPCWAEHDQVVAIHWRLKDGNVYREERTCPPSATTQAKADER